MLNRKELKLSARPDPGGGMIVTCKDCQNDILVSERGTLYCPKCSKEPPAPPLHLGYRLKRFVKALLKIILLLLPIILLCVGIWQIYAPAAWIVLGIVLWIDSLKVEKPK